MIARIRQHPIPILIALLVLTSFACQAWTTLQQPPTVDTGTAVRQAVATIESQRSEGVATPVVTTNTASSVPISGDLEARLVELYQRVNPAVVQIFVFTQQGGLPFSSGSGFVYDAEGYIVTNNHVVADGETFEVVFSGGQRYPAIITGTDVDSDLAVLKVDELPGGVQPIPTAAFDSLQVGQLVIAIGNPFGNTGSMSIGIISGLGRTLRSQRIADGGRFSLPQVIQTDAAINPGNSGGPLLNLQGELVGVNSAILTRTGTNSGVGFSIPVGAVNRIVPALIEHGEYTYTFIGIGMLDREIDLNLQEELDLPQTTGTYILNVSPGTPADEAGLIGSGGDLLDPLPGGDLITAVDGTPLQDSDELLSYLFFETEVGQTIELTVWRDGEEVIVPLTLDARP